MINTFDWTPAAEARLRELWLAWYPVKEIARVLQTTPATVASRAYRRNLCYRNITELRRKWRRIDSLEQWPPEGERKIYPVSTYLVPKYLRLVPRGVISRPVICLSGPHFIFRGVAKPECPSPSVPKHQGIRVRAAELGIPVGRLQRNRKAGLPDDYLGQRKIPQDARPPQPLSSVDLGPQQVTSPAPAPDWVRGRNKASVIQDRRDTPQAVPRRSPRVIDVFAGERPDLDQPKPAAVRPRQPPSKRLPRTGTEDRLTKQTRVWSAEEEAAQIAEFLAKKGVTRCPDAYSAPTYQAAVTEEEQKERTKSVSVEPYKRTLEDYREIQRRKAHKLAVWNEFRRQALADKMRG